MKKKNILWDFDGVILDSMAVRELGFREIFKDFSSNNVDLLIAFHEINGGLSRYVKIRYFFEKILAQSVDDERVMEYANKFSIIMRKELVNKNNLIKDSCEFIAINHKNYNFHIVSGSDQEELRFLCNKLDLSAFFKTIHGSPTPKINLVKNLLIKNNYMNNETCLIGDSINDYEASVENNIQFFGYNNKELKSLNSKYINSFKEILF